MMQMTSKSNILQTNNILNFPEEVDSKNGVKVYSETSWETQLAVLSQYLQGGSSTVSKEQRDEIIAAIREFWHRKQEKERGEEMTDEDAARLAECPAEYNLFSSFFNVPYPNPATGRHTLVDLFAGIGGIRLPFQELGYRCVFSSEWDKYV